MMQFWWTFITTLHIILLTFPWVNLEKSMIFPLLFLSLHILSVLCKKHWMNGTFTVFSAQRKGRIKILHEASLNLSTTPPQSGSSQHSEVTETLPGCSLGARTWRNTSDLKQWQLSGERSVLRFKGNQHPHTDMGTLSHCKCFFEEDLNPLLLLLKLP